MKKILSIALVAVSLFATSCREWLDINVNPNYLGDLDSESLMPAAQTGLASKVGYNMMLLGSFWSQHCVQSSSTNQYNDIYQFDLQYTSSYFSDVWSLLYSQTIPTLNQIIAKSEEEGGSLCYGYMAKILRVYSFYMLNSLYDKVAYTEGCQGIEQPKFDDGKEVYKMLLAELEEIRKQSAGDALEQSFSTALTTQDMIFGCDSDSWYRFANSLYLDMLLRDFDANKSKIQSILVDALLESDACFDNFEDVANKSNPFYESDRRMLNTAENIRCCSGILALMSDSDPRVNDFFENPIGGKIVGGAYGSAATNTTNSSKLKLDASDPVYFLSVAQVEFDAAEAYARLNDAGNAKAHYEAGVQAAFERYGHDAAELLAGDYAFKAGSVESMVKQIIIQKYLSSVRCYAWSSWFDMNRTGYPERGKDIENYSGVLDGGLYPCRYLYPERSSLYNANTPAVEAISAKMWWHKK